MQQISLIQPLSSSHSILYSLNSLCLFSSVFGSVEDPVKKVLVHCCPLLTNEKYRINGVKGKAQKHSSNTQELVEKIKKDCWKGMKVKHKTHRCIQKGKYMSEVNIQYVMKPHHLSI